MLYRVSIVGIPKRGRSPLTKPAPGSLIDWQHPLAQGLIGSWLFDSSLRDNAAGNHANIVGGVTRVCNGLQTDGTSGYISVSDPRGELSPDSVSVVFRVAILTGWGANDRIVDKKSAWSETSGWSISIPNPTQFEIIGSGSTLCRVNVVWPTDKMAGYAITIHGSTAVAYLDGVQRGAGTVDAVVGNTQSLSFGRYNAGGLFTPLVFESCAIFNRTLSPTEIAQLHAAPYQMFWEPRQTLYFNSLITYQYARPLLDLSKGNWSAITS